MDPSKLSAFLSWMKRSGAQWDSVELRPSPDGQRGACVIASRSVDEGTMLLTLPKQAVLSVLTASNSKALGALLEAGLPESAALILAIAHEQGRGRGSRWSGYLASLPSAEPLPFMWSAAELRLLAGTGVDVTARARRAELVREYADLCAWVEANPDAGVALPTLAAYLGAASLASSRAFYVDDEHGEALVPGADAFNHKAALVPEGCEVEGDAEEGEEEGNEDDEGEEDEAEEKEGEEEKEAEEEEEEEEEEGERLADEQLRQTARVIAEAGGLELRMDTTLHNLGAAVGMRAMRPLARGAEVFNTYGEVGNQTLLANYGFVLAEAANPLDTARLAWRALREALAARLGGRAARARERALHGACCWGSALRGRGFAFDRLGRPPPRLLLVAWLLCAAEEEATQWMLTASPQQAAAAAASFARLPLAAQLAPPHVGASPRALLLAAVRAQAGQYTRQGEATPAARGCAARPEVAQSAATLVEGQRAIWLAAEAHLLPSPGGGGEAVGGRRAHGKSRGVVKRRAR